jgi:hypothetical protein
MAAARVPPKLAVVIAVGWEFLERPLKDNFPDLFPHGSQDSFLNATFDTAAMLVSFAAFRRYMGEDDLIPGGLAAGMSPRDFDQVELSRGTEVEREHAGRNTRLAREIAMDHLAEDPYYYQKLAVMEGRS